MNLISSSQIRVNDIHDTIISDTALLTQLDNQAEQNAKQVKQYEQEIENLRAEFSKLVARPDDVVQRESILTSQHITMIQKQLEDAESLDVVCPECKQDIDDGHKQELINRSQATA